MTDFQKNLARARQFFEQGQYEPARHACGQAIAALPDNPDGRLMMGRIELRQGNSDESISQLTRAAELAPASAEIHENLGKALLQAGRAADAIGEFQKEARTRSGDPGTLLRLATAFQAAGQNPRSERAVRDALKLKPDFPEAEYLLVNVLILRKKLMEAIDIMEGYLQRYPDDLKILTALASAYERVNRAEDAERVTDQVLKVDPDQFMAILSKARTEERRGDIEAAEQRLRRLIDSRISGSKPWLPYYRLGFVLDRKGEYSDAFESAAKANLLRFEDTEPAERKAHTYLDFIKRNRSWVENFEAATREIPATGDVPPPVFFVGFPRSGTTLMETILAAHPDILTTEEKSPLTMVFREISRERDYLRQPQNLALLSVEDIAAARKRYMEIAQLGLGQPIEGKLIIDKLPLNIVRLPLIRTLFPDAKVIVAIRDPRDVCLSCFMQNFTLNWAMEHFLDIGSTANIYSQIMGLFLEARGRKIIEFIQYPYEDLASDTKATVERVLGFIGKDWSDEISRHTQRAKNRLIKTPSYQDVVKPVNTRAIGRWRNYREHLAPILPVLRPFVEEFGYEPS